MKSRQEIRDAFVARAAEEGLSEGQMLDKLIDELTIKHEVGKDVAYR